MKNKAQRIAKIGTIKATGRDVASPFEEKQPKSESAPIQATFSIDQCYTARFDENLIDAFIDENYLERNGYTYDDRQEMRTRFKRMYRSIVTNEKALAMMQQFIVLREHDMAMEGGNYSSTYVEEHFKKPLEFEDILTYCCPLFHPDDRQWWEKMVKADQEARKKYSETNNDLYMFDLCLQVEALEHAFRGDCAQSGWSISRIAYHCNDCGNDF